MFDLHQTEWDWLLRDSLRATLGLYHGNWEKIDKRQYELTKARM